MSWYHDPAYEPGVVYSGRDLDYTPTYWEAAVAHNDALVDMINTEGRAGTLNAVSEARFFHHARLGAEYARVAEEGARDENNWELIVRASELAEFLEGEAETAEGWLKTWEYREAPNGSKEWNRETTTATPPGWSTDDAIAEAEADPNCEPEPVTTASGWGNNTNFDDLFSGEDD
jgi:hypothetical protein